MVCDEFNGSNLVNSDSGKNQDNNQTGKGFGMRRKLLVKIESTQYVIAIYDSLMKIIFVLEYQSERETFIKSILTFADIQIFHLAKLCLIHDGSHLQFIKKSL